jgi:hypothetical protein
MHVNNLFIDSLNASLFILVVCVWLFVLRSRTFYFNKIEFWTMLWLKKQSRKWLLWCFFVIFMSNSLFRSRSVTLTKRWIKADERKTCRNRIVFKRVFLWLMFVSFSTWKSWIREYDLKIDLNRIDFRNALRKFEDDLSWTLN